MKWPMIASAVLFIYYANEAAAYEVPTHSRLSMNAAVMSKLNDPEMLRQLGLRPYGIGDKRQKFYTDAVTTVWAREKTIIELIAFGAEYEDERSAQQALHHFYNPVNGQALNVQGTTPGHPSPSWILEDSEVISGQPYSYKKARQYLFDALTKPTGFERQRAWGATFQTLGHVIHHLQDMAQPQHVRNDPHCDSIVFCKVLLAAYDVYHPSGYETWHAQALRPDVFLQQYGAVYSEADNQVFTTPRKFWSTSVPFGTGGAGIAEYTSRGFFSSGTLQTPDINPAYPLPRVSSTNYSKVNIQTLCQEASGTANPCPEGLTGVMQFYPSVVTDNLRPGATATNERAVTTSIFDAELEKKHYSPIQSLNRFNHDAAGAFLLPRAVGYSAGMINFFFRGKMEISLPEEGVYGIVDHVDPDANTKDTGGFRKIKVKVKNVTPGAGGIAQMSTEGKLVLVAKFHRNKCYTPSLSGEYGAPGIDWKTCREEYEDIVVSGAVAAPAEINGDGAQLTFLFEKPVPINATDLHLQVVYRGKLGDEVEGLAVSTKDISEPHYLNSYTRWDQYRYDYYYPVLDMSRVWTYTRKTAAATTTSSTVGAHSWEEWCTGSSSPGFPTLDACNVAQGLTIEGKYSAGTTPFPNYDPANPGPLGDPKDPLNTPAEWHKLVYKPAYGPVFRMVAPVGTMTRVSVLTDAEPKNAILWMLERKDETHNTGSYQWFWGTPITTVNQLDETTGTMKTTTTYGQARGVFVPSVAVEELSVGDANPFPDLTLTRSTINF